MKIFITTLSMNFLQSLLDYICKGTTFFHISKLFLHFFAFFFKLFYKVLIINDLQTKIFCNGFCRGLYLYYNENVTILFQNVPRCSTLDTPPRNIFVTLFHDVPRLAPAYIYARARTPTPTLCFFAT